MFLIKTVFRIIKVSIFIAIFVSLTFLFYHAYGVYSSSKIHSKQKTDAIIVLGAAQFNGQPSPVFQARLDHARELYEEKISNKIITVGGKQKGDKYTEAESGKTYLTQFIEKDKILAIKDGKDTLESFELIRKKYPDLNKVTLVSDPAHLWRSNIIAKDLGFEPYLSSTLTGPGSLLTTKYLIRELISTINYELIKFNILNTKI